MRLILAQLAFPSLTHGFLSGKQTIYLMCQRVLINSQVALLDTFSRSSPASLRSVIVGQKGEVLEEREIWNAEICVVRELIPLLIGLFKRRAEGP